MKMLTMEREIRSFVSEGYFVSFSILGRNNIFCASLIHRSNGNRIIVKIEDDTVIIKKNNKQVKTYEI